MSWPLVTIKSVSKVVTGKTPSKSNDDFFGGDIPFVTPAELNKEIYVYDAKQTLTDLGANQIKLIPENSVMVCCIGSLGKIAIAGRAMATNQQINTVIFDEEKVDPKYGFYALSKLKNKMEDFAPSTTVAIVNKSNFESFEIPLPPLKEQKRIAAILDKADAIRRKRQQAIKLADEFLRTVFLDTFGDPVTNPKGWDVKKIEDVVLKVTDGVHFKPNYIDSGVPFISVKNITTGKLLFDDTKFVSQEDHEKYIKRCNPEYMDILYTKVGATYGRPAIIDVKKDFSLYVSVALIKPDHNKINALFLKEVLATSALKRQADRAVKGAGVPDLHLVEIKSFLLPVPAMKIQDAYVTKVLKIHKKNELNIKSLMKMDEIFKSLCQKAFAGIL